jgi:hypothetical protein
MTELTTAERKTQGKAARATAPLESHADIGPDAGRDPVGLIVGQAATRVRVVTLGSVRAAQAGTGVSDTSFGPDGSGASFAR